MSDRLKPFYPLLSYNYRYLYEYGHALHQDNIFEESNRILSEGAAISCDPMFHNVMGLNYQKMHEYELAEAEFKQSHKMVPHRILPLYFLMQLYEEQKREEEAMELATIIVNAPINPKNKTMVMLQQRVKRSASHAK